MKHRPELGRPPLETNLGELEQTEVYEDEGGGLHYVTPKGAVMFGYTTEQPKRRQSVPLGEYARQHLERFVLKLRDLK